MTKHYFWSSPADNLFFGPYPTQEVIDVVLVDFPNILVVDLTQRDEDVEKYMISAQNYYSYPIKDNNVPLDENFAPFITQLSSMKRPLFIHCKGGHGRSSMISACILCYKYGKEPEEALRIVSEAHRTRGLLSEKWRHKAYCMRLCQRNFVYDNFSPLYIRKVYKRGSYNGLNVCSLHSILHRGVVFACAEFLFQALKDFDNEDYRARLLSVNTRFVYLAKNIGEEHFVMNEEDWNARRFETMKFVYQLKLEQHPTIMEYLVTTRLVPIIDISRNAHYNNLVGRVLWSIRDDYYRQLSINLA